MPSSIPPAPSSSNATPLRRPLPPLATVLACFHAAEHIAHVVQRLQDPDFAADEDAVKLTVYWQPPARAGGQTPQARIDAAFAVSGLVREVADQGRFIDAMIACDPRDAPLPAPEEAPAAYVAARLVAACYDDNARVRTATGHDSALCAGRQGDTLILAYGDRSDGKTYALALHLAVDERETRWLRAQLTKQLTPATTTNEEDSHA